MKLSTWAKSVGLTYRGAYRQFKAGQIPGAYQLPTGTVIIPDQSPGTPPQKNEHVIKIVLEDQDIDDKTMKEFERFARLYFTLAKKKGNKKKPEKPEIEEKSQTLTGEPVTCYQYTKKMENWEEDLKAAGLTKKKAEKLRVSDLTFEFVHSNPSKDALHEFDRPEDLPPFDKNKVAELRRFIERFEWLQTFGQYSTHLFCCRYQGHLVAVQVFDMPIVFSKMMGENTRKIERLISRGASISWAPKNTASALIMWSIRWMVAHTRYRIFTAYSDPGEGVNELGVVYQAANFIYLGQASGTKSEYLYKGKWVSDRSFRSRSAYKRYAKELKIKWNNSWSSGDRILWKNVPDKIELKLKDKVKQALATCEKRETMPKHKYVYVLGRTNKETKELRKEFVERNKIMAYPKERGK